MAERNVPAWVAPLAMGAACAGLFWLERRYPLRTQGPDSSPARVVRNLALAAVVGAVVNTCERPVVNPVSRWVERRGIGLLPRLALPAKLETAAGLILLDYTLYWWHILLHRSPLLWRSHRVHHSDRVLDSTSALRFHAAEFVASIPWRLGQVMLLGIRPSTLRLWQRLTLVEVFFHHSNWRLPKNVEHALSHWIVTPRMHGIHHSVAAQEMHSNFSSGLTVWDAMHKTLRRDIAQKDITIGVEEIPRPDRLSLAQLLLIPFRERI